MPLLLVSLRYLGFLDLVFVMDTRSSSSQTTADPRTKYPSRWSILLHTNDMTLPAHQLDINTLHNAHGVEELIHLTVLSDTEIIVNFHWTEYLSLEYSQCCCIGA